MEGEDDDDELALYLPHHKDKPKENSDMKSSSVKPAEPTPGIRGSNPSNSNSDFICQLYRKEKNVKKIILK